MGYSKEINFEELIEDSLVQGGYIQGAPAEFDRSFAIDKGMFIKFLEKTQEETLNAFKKANGYSWKKTLFDTLVSQIENRGMIDVLRHGVEHYSLTN